MIEVLTSRADLLGECPIWDDRTGHLLSIDIDGRAIHRHDVATGAFETRTLEGRPGAVALTDDPDVLLAAVEGTLLRIQWSAETSEPWLDLATGGPNNRLNDGALDRDGRLWIGTMHEDATESSGLLHRVQPDGSSAMLQDGIGVSNGIAFAPDGGTMYFADSIAHTVWTYPYDRSTGERGAGRVLTDFSNLPGTCDGATVDADGCYWIACVFGSAVARLTPDGDLDRLIELPVDKPTKPAFGGPGLDTLFVTSIGGGASHVRYEDPGLNGCLLALDVGVTGAPEPVMPIL